MKVTRNYPDRFGFWGELGVIVFRMKNDMNMRKIVSRGKLTLSTVDFIEWHIAIVISYSL